MIYQKKLAKYISELLGLRWSDVDFNSGKLYVRQTMQDGRFYEPKTERSRRSIPIPDILIEELKIHQAYQVVSLDENKHDLVFTNTRGGPVNARNLTRRTLRRAIRKAGLREIERPFHSFRHTYVSILVNQGENIKLIQKLVGHSSARITWDIYSHLYPESEKEAMRKLALNFGTTTVPRPKKEGQPSSVADPSTR